MRHLFGFYPLWSSRFHWKTVAAWKAEYLKKNAHFWAMHHENQCGEPLYAGRGFIVFKVRRGEREERWYNVKWTSTIPRFYSIHSGQKIQDLPPKNDKNRPFPNQTSIKRFESLHIWNPFRFVSLRILIPSDITKSLRKSLR